MIDYAELRSQLSYDLEIKEKKYFELCEKYPNRYSGDKSDLNFQKEFKELENEFHEKWTHDYAPDISIKDGMVIQDLIQQLRDIMYNNPESLILVEFGEYEPLIHIWTKNSKEK